MKTRIYSHSQKKILQKIALMAFGAMIFLLNSCQKNTVQEPTASQNSLNENEDAIVASSSNEMVLTWNNAGTVAWVRTGIPTPYTEARLYAMVNIAMHDALNCIKPKYKTYALLNTRQKDASPDAAVAQAAHDVIVSVLAIEQDYADSLLEVSLSSIPDCTAKTKGIGLGKAAAAAIIAKRQNDGSADASCARAQGTLPGEYRSTPPFDGPPFNGFMDVPCWGNVTPFALHSGSQFRPVAPYAVNSPEYTADFKEIKRLGGINSTARTPEQTQIALFWMESAPLGWNHIARTLIMQRNLDAWKTARLLALLQIAEADANIAVFNAKYYYFFWRPITAIRLADTDGNPDTKGDPSWDVLAPPTPPVPDYPSGHAVDGSAAAEVLVQFFQKDKINFSATSGSLPNVTRSFTSLTEAARENSLSRIYLGIHFRNAVINGQAQGTKIGDYVFIHVLGPAE